MRTKFANSMAACKAKAVVGSRALILVGSIAFVGTSYKSTNAQTVNIPDLLQISPSDSFTSAINGNTIIVTPTSPTTAFVAAIGPVPFTGNFTASNGTLAPNPSGTITGTAISGSATAQVNCNISSVGNSGQCGPIGFAGPGTPAVNTALAGTNQASAQAQTQSATRLLNWRFQKITRDVAPSPSQPGQRSQLPVETITDMSASDMSVTSEDKRWNIWASAAPSWLKNNSADFFSEGYGIGTLAGIDYNFKNGWFVGLDAGYVRTDLKVRSIGGNQIVNGAQLGPYVTYIINENLTADASFGYTRSAHSTNGNNNGLNAPANSSFDSNSYSGTLALNAYGVWNDIGLTGTFGFTYTSDYPTTLVSQPIGGVPTTVHSGSLVALAKSITVWANSILICLSASST